MNDINKDPYESESVQINEDNKDNKKNNEQKYKVKNESDSPCIQINKPRVLFIVFFLLLYL